MSWKYTKECCTLLSNTNVFIACFTTAYARLEDYHLLDSLQERCLYHDTDSVIFVSKEGAWNPTLRDYLGDLTSEIPPDEHIVKFVSAGSKTYGYKLSSGKTCMKVKGIMLNSGNSEKIYFESLKLLVWDYPMGEVSKEIVGGKKQKVINDKRALEADFKTLPYGYYDEEPCSVCSPLFLFAL